jgi:hypothetical protein
MVRRLTRRKHCTVAAAATVPSAGNSRDGIHLFFIILSCLQKLRNGSQSLERSWSICGGRFAVMGQKRIVFGNAWSVGRRHHGNGRRRQRKRSVRENALSLWMRHRGAGWLQNVNGATLVCRSGGRFVWHAAHLPLPLTCHAAYYFLLGSDIYLWLEPLQANPVWNKPLITL